MNATKGQSSFVARLRAMQELWGVVCNHPEPPMRTWILWLSGYTDAEIERAFLQVDFKFVTAPTDPDGVYRFVSSELRQMKERRNRGFDGRGQ